MKGRDIGFAGSPVIFRHRYCGQLVAAVNKDGFIYVWRATKVAAGTLFRLRLSSPTNAAPLLSQPAYSGLTGAIYVATPGRLVRVDVTRRCRGRVTWGSESATGCSTARRRLPGTPSGWQRTPTAVRACSASTRAPASTASGPSSAAPRTSRRPSSVIGSFSPATTAACRPSCSTRLARGPSGRTRAPCPSTAASPTDCTAGRAVRTASTRVTTEGARGASVYPRNAIRVARVSAQTGMISLGDRVTDCGCRQVRLWTADAGVHWHATREGAGGGFVGAGRHALVVARRESLPRGCAGPPASAGAGCADSGSRSIKGVILDAKPAAGRRRRARQHSNG